MDGLEEKKKKEKLFFMHKNGGSAKPPWIPRKEESQPTSILSSFGEFHKKN